MRMTAPLTEQHQTERFNAMKRPHYLADAYACFALAGIRTVERSESLGGSRSLKVTYKGYEARVSYGTKGEACDAMYQRLCAALTQAATAVAEKEP